MTEISSTCCAMCGYQSETHMPLWPYCLKVRLVPISVLLAVPMAVMGVPNDAGMGWPASSLQLRLGIEQIEVAGTALHEQPDDGFGFGRMVRLLGRQRIGRIVARLAVLVKHAKPARCPPGRCRRA